MAPRPIRRFVERVRALFGGGRGGSSPGRGGKWDDGGVGVREPRRPRPSSDSGAVALEPPPADLDPPDAVSR